MNYKYVYDQIIAKAKREDYSKESSEIHHILPKCLGGSNKPENLVRLLPRQHYICHLLLTGIHPTNGKLLYAAKNMARYSKYKKGAFDVFKLYKKRQSARMKANWADPEFRKKFKEKRSENLKKQWMDPEWRKRHCESMSRSAKKRVERTGSAITRQL